MKEVYCSLALIVLSLSIFAQQKTTAKKQALKFIRDYDPEGYQIMKAYYQAAVEYEFGGVNISLAPQTAYEVYIDSSSLHHLLRSLNTVVHEASHGYTHHTVFRYLEKDKIDYEWGKHFSLFYINKDEQLLVKHTPTFPSSRLHGSIPDSIQTSRYETYIYPSAEITTQTIGIYGLLDEWHAYYHGTKNSVRLLPYYQRYSRNNHDLWVNYFIGVHGTYLSYLEFKLFILHYLMYAEKYEAEIFEEIMANESFRVACTQIDSLFSALMTDFLQQKQKILQDLMAVGVNCGEDEEFVFMGTTGYGNFRATYEKLDQVLKRPNYQQMWTRLSN